MPKAASECFSPLSVALRNSQPIYAMCSAATGSAAFINLKMCLRTPSHLSKPRVLPATGSHSQWLSGAQVVSNRAQPSCPLPSPIWKAGLSMQYSQPPPAQPYSLGPKQKTGFFCAGSSERSCQKRTPPVSCIVAEIGNVGDWSYVK